MTAEHDTDDLDFAMLTPPTRPGPCEAATAPEVDPVEKRLEQAQMKAAFIRPIEMTQADVARRAASSLGKPLTIEVRHGSGKVKV